MVVSIVVKRVRKFALAYFREELKAKGCNPDIIPQQSGKDSNPYKTKHVDMCNKELGKESSGYKYVCNWND